MSLQIRIGDNSEQGPRKNNEDVIGSVIPEGDQAIAKGVCIAIADGVGGSSNGYEAASMTIKSLLSDYYATPDTWSVQTALEKVIHGVNSWVHTHSVKQKYQSSLATTLSALVLKGGRYVIAHVGDTRIYLLRKNKFKLLTTDHVWDRPEMTHVLTRAIGLEKSLIVDFCDGEMFKGDKFIMLSDGVWGVVSENDIKKLLSKEEEPSVIAEQLTQLSIHNGGLDNASVAVAVIDNLGENSFIEEQSIARNLPVPGKLKKGDKIDDFKIEENLHDSRKNRLFKVNNGKNQFFVLKTPQPYLGNNSENSNALINEEWLAKRIVSPFFPQVHSVGLDKRHYLYYLMTWHEGATLQERINLGHFFSINGAIKIGTQIAQGLSTLHRLNIIHRDIKPDNIHQGSDQQIRILDLGVALNSEVTSPTSMVNPGTPSFMAPELFNGEQASVQSDLYALGVTLYYVLTRKYPYGEIEAFQTPNFGKIIPPTRYRPEIPEWLNNIIIKAISREKESRFETSEEMLLAFEYKDRRPVSIQKISLLDQARFEKWQLGAILSIFLNILLIYFLLIT